MSLKAELDTWAAALLAYDEEDFERALELFAVCPLSTFMNPIHLFRYSKSQTIPKYSAIWV